MSMWAEREIVVLQREYPVLGSDIPKLLVNRSKDAIQEKARTLGIKYRRTVSSHRKWAESDDEKLERIYPTAQKEEILKLFPNRSWDAISLRANKLKLRRGNFIPPLQKVPFYSLSEPEKAWLACFLDSEGTIGITKKLRSFCHRPYVSASNTDIRLLNRFKELTDIKNVIAHMKRENPKHKPCYIIRTEKMPFIYGILRHVLPYLVAKATQAKMVLEFIEIRHGSLKAWNGNRISETSRQQEIVRDICKLNQRGST